MAKLTAWVVTIIGLLLVLKAALPTMSLGTLLDTWLIPVGVLVVGVGKLVRNYSYKPAPAKRR